MIKDKAQKEKCKKTEIRCNFSESIKEVLQHNQFKYKIMLCISLKKKKIIHQRYITSNDEYIFSEFYIWAKQLQEKLWRYDFSWYSERQLMKKNMIYNWLWQMKEKSEWSLT